MEELQMFLTNYAVFPIALFCFIVGYVIKHHIKSIKNDLIPLILAVLGLVMNVGMNGWDITFEIAITGVASGLVATGSFEAVRNLAKKKPKVEEETKE